MTLTPHGDHYRDDDTGRMYPRVTSILESAGIAVFYDMAEREYYLGRGQAVHLATALSDQGILNEATVEDDIRPYLQGWRCFVDDTDITFDAVEQTVFSAIYGYAGTLDRVGILNGNHCIIDIKTGPKNPATGIQLAAYKVAYLDGGPMGHAYNRYAVHLTREGKYSLVQYGNHTDRNVFLSALTVYRWQQREGIESS